MRISECFIGLALGMVVGVLPALAFDGTKSKDDITPIDSFRAGTRAYYAGDKKEAVDRLRDAAEKGHAIAQWKLGRMYAEGDGVDPDDKKAFDYFSRVANAHADDNPNTPEAPFVANSFVALGRYYQKGIDNAVNPNLNRARDMYTYAASYFGNADAQFQLGRMYMTGDGGQRDLRQAARWLKLAAKKKHVAAAVAFGEVVFVGGDQMPPRPVFGLAWLLAAKRFAKEHEKNWVGQKQEQYFALADVTQREQAVKIADIIIGRIAKR